MTPFRRSARSGSIGFLFSNNFLAKTWMGNFANIAHCSAAPGTMSNIVVNGYYVPVVLMIPFAMPIRILVIW